MRKATLIRHLQKRFPDIHGIKDAEGWGEPGAIHLGNCAEGGEIDGLPACDCYSEDWEEKTYVFGVHRKLRDFISKRGWEVQCHDAGTYLAYEA